MLPFQAQLFRYIEGRRQHQAFSFTFSFSVRPYLIYLTLKSSDLIVYTWCCLISSVFCLSYINCYFLFLSVWNLLVLSYFFFLLYMINLWLIVCRMKSFQAHLHSCEKHLLVSLCLSVCISVQLPPNRFLWNLILRTSVKLYPDILDLVTVT